MRRQKPSDYWYNVLIGGLLATVLITLPVMCFLALLGFKYAPVTAGILATSIVAYCQWQDDNYTVVTTGLTRNENNNVIKAAISTVNWRHIANTNFIEPTLERYFFKFLNPEFIAETNVIYLNFQYRSTSRVGRLPFFFGISVYYKRKLIKAIKESVPSLG